MPCSTATFNFFFNDDDDDDDEHAKETLWDLDDFGSTAAAAPPPSTSTSHLKPQSHPISRPTSSLFSFQTQEPKVDSKSSAIAADLLLLDDDNNDDHLMGGIGCHRQQGISFCFSEIISV